MKNIRIRNFLTIMLMVFVLALSACTTDRYGREHLTKSGKGAIIGGAGGALVGSMVGGSSGALIGGAAGAVGGAAIGDHF